MDVFGILMVWLLKKKATELYSLITNVLSNGKRSAKIL